MLIQLFVIRKLLLIAKLKQTVKSSVILQELLILIWQIGYLLTLH